MTAQTVRPQTITAKWVVPCEGPPVADGAVVFCDGRITAVGAADDPVIASAASGGTTEPLGEAILLPGLVNAHTHLEFSDCATPLLEPGVPLPQWIQAVIAQRSAEQRDPVAAIRQGLTESLAEGVTTVGEIATQPAAAYATSAPQPTLVLFQEALGFAASQADSVTHDVRDRIGQSKALGLRVGVSPHAPYSVHPELLGRIVGLSADRDLPLAMHLAESPEELQLLSDGRGPFRELLEKRGMWDFGAIDPGSTPLDYLQQLARSHRTLVVHGNYLGTEEIALLASHRDKMCVVYCPRTHRYFGHARYRLPELLAAGVRVAIGTDSRASTPDLSVLAELREVTKHYPEVTLSKILAMGTLGAAQALGLEAEVGSLAPGKRADIIAVPFEKHLSGNQSDPLEHLLHGNEKNSAVWLAGQRVSNTEG